MAKVKEDILNLLINNRQIAKKDGNRECMECAERAIVEIAKLRRLLGLKPGKEQG